MHFLAQTPMTGYEGLILAALNVIQLGLSAWNNRKLARSRDTQKVILRAVQNGNDGKVVK